MKRLLAGIVFILSQIANGFFYPVTNFTFTHSKTNKNSIEFKFSAFDENFKFDTNYEQQLIAPEMKSTIYAQNYSYLQPHEVKGYTARTKDYYATFVVTNDNLMHGLVVRNGEFYEIAPKNQYLNHPQYKNDLKSIPNDLVAFKHSSIDWHGIKCGTNDHIHQIKKLKPVSLSPLSLSLEQEQEQDLASAISPSDGNQPPLNGPFPSLWTACYPGSNILHREFVGFAVDYGAYKLMGNSVANVQAYLTSLLMNINYVYSNQANIYLVLSATSIQTSPGTTQVPWNQDSSGGQCNSIDSTLNTFTTWRQSTSTQSNMQVSVWHLLSGCWQPPGVVGLAWVGSLCDNKYSTGASSVFPGNWVAVAHEIGHNHGANHSWPADRPDLVGTIGGIMDYGPGKFPLNTGIYEFHPTICKSLVCNELTAAMNGQCLTGCQPLNKCFQATAAICGNGIIETGEMCDDGPRTGTSLSCCASNCQPKLGTQCISGECCDTSCHYKNAGFSCGTNKGGYCGPNGACITTTCAYYGLPYCGINPLTNCTTMCYINGGCNSMAGYVDSTTRQPLNMKVQDNSTCIKINRAGVCSSGLCI